MWMMWIYLVGMSVPQYLGPYNSQMGCWKESMQITAMDPEIEKTQCIPWEDRVPNNIG